MSINICDLCKELEFPACSDEITLVAGMTPSFDYYTWLRDRNGHSYNIYTPSDGSGSIAVALSSFVSLYNIVFTSDSGVWELTISDNEGDDTGEIITINGEEYPCLLLSFYDLN